MQLIPQKLVDHIRTNTVMLGRDELTYDKLKSLIIRYCENIPAGMSQDIGALTVADYEWGALAKSAAQRTRAAPDSRKFLLHCQDLVHRRGEWSQKLLRRVCCASHRHGVL